MIAYDFTMYAKLEVIVLLPIRQLLNRNQTTLTKDVTSHDTTINNVQNQDCIVSPIFKGYDDKTYNVWSIKTNLVLAITIKFNLHFQILHCYLYNWPLNLVIDNFSIGKTSFFEIYIMFGLIEHNFNTTKNTIIIQC